MDFSKPLGYEKLIITNTQIQESKCSNENKKTASCRIDKNTNSLWARRSNQ